jgi:hypothetical protein
MTLTSQKIANGLYTATVQGRTFQMEDHYKARGDGAGIRGEWALYEINERGDREYCNHFWGKKACLDAVYGIVVLGED